MSEKRSCCCGALPAVGWWLLTVLGLALLFWLMVASRQNSVETDLTARATDGLKAASLDAVQVNLGQRGRDAQLTGQLASDAEREQAVKLVEATYGVRVVDNAIEVIAPVAAATTVTTAPALAPPAEATATTTAPTTESTAAASTTTAAPSSTAAASTTTAAPASTAAASTTTAAPASTAAASTTTAAPASTATAAPRFALLPQAGQWVLQGALSSQAEVNQAVASAEQIYGAGNVINQLTVESVAPAAWLASLSGLKEVLMGIEQAGLKFADNTFTLIGSVGSEQAKADVLAKVQQVLGVNQLDNQLTVKLAALTVTPTPTAEPAAPAPVSASTVTAASPTSPTTPAAVALTTEQQSCQDQINTVMTGKEVLFETNQARIKQASLSLLNDIAKIVNQCKVVLADKLIRVGGHTDNIGEDAYNQNLSQERADAVKAYLNQQGLDLGLLQGIGYGETQPLASNDTEQGRAQNRRISFDIIQK
ncbi:Outer membrane protein OmpA [Thiothrix eikelboomii]|uniref:Outer membrane protein OmpA n=1 Tax=Thiothrix eikelboomii TaxID=92487 RepID=A0A1T4WB16_9GAMM|nr:OmpA family protein [Thiothrix eikelboomii]SKA74514.1 Outer membrane protein OmpA [Thiothrix eikelboomii]